MPLPGSCADPVAPCCDNLFTLVSTMVEAAADAVEECFGDEPCPPFTRFVNHAPPVGPGDYVAGTITDIRPAPSQQATNGARQLFVFRQLVTIEVSLVETGYPTLEIVGSRISKPTSDAWNYAAVHSYSHGEQALRALLRTARGLCGNGCCESMQLNNARPMPPQSDLATWVYTFVARWEP